MACKYFIRRPFYFSKCAGLGKTAHRSGVEMETRTAKRGVRLSPSGFAWLCAALHFETVHQHVNFITFKIYSYAGITEHPICVFSSHKSSKRKQAICDRIAGHFSKRKDRHVYSPLLCFILILVLTRLFEGLEMALEKAPLR